MHSHEGMGSPRVGKLLCQCCLLPLRVMSRGKQALSPRGLSLLPAEWCVPLGSAGHTEVPPLRASISAAVKQDVPSRGCGVQLYSFPNSCKVRRGRGRPCHNFIDKASWYLSFNCMLCVHAFDLCEIPARSCQPRRTSVNSSAAPPNHK